MTNSTLNVRLGVKDWEFCGAIVEPNISWYKYCAKLSSPKTSSSYLKRTKSTSRGSLLNQVLGRWKRKHYLTRVLVVTQWVRRDLVLVTQKTRHWTLKVLHLSFALWTTVSPLYGNRTFGFDINFSHGEWDVFVIVIKSSLFSYHLLLRTTLSRSYNVLSSKVWGLDGTGPEN